jgi:hypothetical protein
MLDPPHAGAFDPERRSQPYTGAFHTGAAQDDDVLDQGQLWGQLL